MTIIEDVAVSSLVTMKMNYVDHRNIFVEESNTQNYYSQTKKMQMNLVDQRNLFVKASNILHSRDQ